MSMIFDYLHQCRKYLQINHLLVGTELILGERTVFTFQILDGYFGAFRWGPRQLFCLVT